MVSKEVDEILKKYSKKIESEIKVAEENVDIKKDTSNEFLEFKQDEIPELSKYEKWAKNLGGLIKIKLAKKDEDKIAKQLSIAHLDITPSDVVGLAFFVSFGIMFFSGLFGLALWLTFDVGFNSISPFLFLIFISSAFVFYYYYTFPERLATKWRLKASSQMVPAILYTVVYMKHTSNLERAISFVAQHIEAPLSYDLKKVLWDVETGKYSSVKESLDVYLDSWKDYNMEFIESFHLIESSLYEPNEARRIEILERSLRVILDGVYDKMLKYTHDIRAPLTNLYMLGIVLPTLGLALLPLASVLLGGLIKWSHVFIIFNIIIPFVVFYLTMNIMLSRPGGYGEVNLLEKNPYYYKYKSKSVYWTAGALAFPFFLIGILPLIFEYTPVPDWLGLGKDFVLSGIWAKLLGEKFFKFIPSNGGFVGPFGTGALLLSLLVPLSIIIFFSLSYSMRTKKLIETRKDFKDLEDEFNNSLFTLGNRLGDGTPAEIAFVKVAESTKGQKTEKFFKIVSMNIQSMGMSLENAIFNPKRGALIYYPSNLIATSMRILIESVKKGLTVAAQSLMSISDYVRNINKINERLKDLLAEVISDMKGNMTFLAPLLAGVVIGLAAMITKILGNIKNMIGNGNIPKLGGVSLGSMAQMFDIEKMIPPYYLQIAIGIYIIQIIFILTSTLVTVNSGEDKLKQTYDISKNLLKGGLLYIVVAFVSIISLSLLSKIALSGVAG